MEERKRIANEIDRIQKTLRLKGFPPNTEPPLSTTAIKGVSVHGLWDGIVGHPVDVNISLLVRLSVIYAITELMNWPM